MWYCGITCFSAQANYLSLPYSIANFYQGSVFLQMPVTTSGIIAVLNYNIISLAAIFFTPPAFGAIFFYSCYYTISYGQNICPSFHFKIKSGSFFMGKNSKITLHDQVSFLVFKWQYVYKTGIVLDLSFLKLFNFFTQGILANSTSRKKATKN